MTEEPKLQEVCPRCHKFRGCICAPAADASDAAKRAHEIYLRTLEAIEGKK